MDIKKYSFSLDNYEKLNHEYYETFLLVGHILNEINWLSKLLIKSMNPQKEECEEIATLVGLTHMLMTLLASKIHEADNRLRSENIKNIIFKSARLFNKEKELETKRDSIKKFTEKDSLIHFIRSNLAYHYPHRLHFKPLDEIETSIFIHPTEAVNKFNGISSFAAYQPLVLKINPNAKTSREIMDALRLCHDELMNITGNYIHYVNLILSCLTRATFQNVTVNETVISKQATNQFLEEPFMFFISPNDK